MAIAGALAELVDRLHAAVRNLSTGSSVDDWCTAMAAALADLCAVPDTEAWQWRAVERVLEEVRAEATVEGVPRTAVIDPGDLSALVRARLAGGAGRPRFGTGAVTVSSLTAQRGVPHRVVCLLGLDDDAGSGSLPRLRGPRRHHPVRGRPRRPQRAAGPAARRGARRRRPPAAVQHRQRHPHQRCAPAGRVGGRAARAGRRQRPPPRGPSRRAGERRHHRLAPPAGVVGARPAARRPRAARPALELRQRCPRRRGGPARPGPRCAALPRRPPAPSARAHGGGRGPGAPDRPARHRLPERSRAPPASAPRHLAPCRGGGARRRHPARARAAGDVEDHRPPAPGPPGVRARCGGEDRGGLGGRRAAARRRPAAGVRLRRARRVPPAGGGPARGAPPGARRHRPRPEAVPARRGDRAAHRAPPAVRHRRRRLRAPGRRGHRCRG